MKEFLCSFNCGFFNEYFRVNCSVHFFGLFADYYFEKIVKILRKPLQFRRRFHHFPKDQS